MTLTAFLLYPRYPFRLRAGEGRLDRTGSFIHAPTLFSALVNTYVKLNGEDRAGEFLESMRLSSVCYGLAWQKERVFFFPRPLFPPPVTADPARRKTSKRVKWLSHQAMERFLSGFDQSRKDNRTDLADPAVFISINPQFMCVAGELPVEGGINGTFIRTVLEPKVAVGRASGTSLDLYFQEEIELTPCQGLGGEQLFPFLFFLMDDGVSDDHFSATMNLLIEEGIGGERGSGKGVFERWDSHPLDIPREGAYEALLSTAIPDQSEMDRLCYYSLVKNSGFIFRSMPLGARKKAVYQLQEGSVVRTPFQGVNRDVSPIPGQPVITYGKALGWGFGEKAGGQTV